MVLTFMYFLVSFLGLYVVSAFNFLAIYERQKRRAKRCITRQRERRRNQERGGGGERNSGARRRNKVTSGILP